MARAVGLKARGGRLPRKAALQPCRVGVCSVGAGTGRCIEGAPLARGQLVRGAPRDRPGARKSLEQGLPLAQAGAERPLEREDDPSRELFKHVMHSLRGLGRPQRLQQVHLRGALRPLPARL